MCQEQSWLLLLHLCDVGLAATWLSTLLGPMAKLATVVPGVVSCRLLVIGGGAGGASAGATLGTPLRPGLGASARLVPLAAFAATRRGRGLPLLPSHWQASHCSRVRCSFPPTVIGPERGYGSSPLTTLRRLRNSELCHQGRPP
jgi:hypothetical protein